MIESPTSVTSREGAPNRLFSVRGVVVKESEECPNCREKHARQTPSQVGLWTESHPGLLDTWGAAVDLGGMLVATQMAHVGLSSPSAHVSPH